MQRSRRQHDNSAGEALPREASPLSQTPSHLAEKILKSRSALEGERKQVTVLFCDIVNSTALAERLGPETMHSLLDAFFERSLAEVHRYEGMINQFLGDGFMALFGAPLAHEDHARRAVLAAWGIKESLRERPIDTGEGHGRELTVRMGLNSGFVVVGKIGDSLRMDYTAVGDTTNLAARLQSLAEPGTIYLSETTHHAAEASIHCAPLGNQAVKGKAKPVAVYKLEGVSVRPQARGGPEARGIGSPLVGRDGEVAALLGSVERLEAGQGGVVLLSGDPGVGKSRLVAEVRSSLRDDGLLWLEGRALSYGRTISYCPFLEIIRTIAGITEEDSEAQSWAKLEARTGELFPAQMVEVLPYLGTLLGLRVKDEFEERVKYLDARAMGAQILLSARRFFEQLAKKQPIVLVFEDFHWIDQSSAELLEHLLPLVGQVPLLLVGISRSDDDVGVGHLRTLARELYGERVTDIALSPLPASESTRLLENLLGGAISPGERTLILRRAEGNAFFLEEIVRSLIAMGALQRDEAGEWQAAARLEEITLPDTIQGVIMARVDRLEEDVREVLKVASVIGRGFLYRVLDAIAETATGLDQDLAELQEVELIREKRRIPELEYIFKHVLVQEATYESILVQRRRELHRRVGECIERLFADRLEEFYGLLAHHFSQAEEWEKALAYLLKAGDEAGRVAADVEALAHYDKALATYARVFGDRWDPLQRAQLERKIGEALFRRGQHDQAIEHLRRALAHLGTAYPHSRRGVRLSIGRAVLRQLRHRLLPRLFVTQAAGRASIAAEERYLAYEAMAWMDYRGDQERLVLDVLLMLNTCERNRLDAGSARGYAAIGVALDLVPLRWLARRYHERAVGLAEQIRHPIAIGLSHLGRAIHEYNRGEWGTALEHCERAAAAYADAGHLRGWGAATALSAWVLRLKGEFSDSLRIEEDVLRVGRDAADVELQAWGLGSRGRLLWRMGAPDEAVGQLEQALDLFRSIPDYLAAADALSDLGTYYLHMGDLDRASAALEESDRLVAERGLRGFELTQPRVAFADCSLRLAEKTGPAERRGALRKANHACRAALKHSKAVRDGAPGACRAKGTYKWLRGKPAAARRWWRRSLAVAEQLGARYELGLTELEMGRRLKERTHLERAKAIFADIGATLDLSQAEEALRDAAASQDVLAVRE